MTLDPRTNAYRPDIADARLKGKVTSARFVDGTPLRIRIGDVPLRRAPAMDAPMDSEILCGEIFNVFDNTGGWSWGQLETDGYVGYVLTQALEATTPESKHRIRATAPAPTHRISALRAFIYREPDMKTQTMGHLSFGSRIALAGEIVNRGTTYRLLDDSVDRGAIVASQAESLDAPPATDFVAVAERFLNVAYLWGGRTSLGLDCSALVQLSLAAAGRKAPRDTDQQEKALGTPIDGTPKRGDLAFWKGHVGIMIDGEYVVHSTGHFMAVVVESLAAIVGRAGPTTSIRRLG